MNKKQFNRPFIITLFLISLMVFTSCVSRKKQIKKADLHHQLAFSMMKNCQYPAALAELRKAIQLKKEDPVFHHSIALLYVQFKKYKTAIQHLKTSLKLKPDFTSARVHLGRSLFEIGQWEQGMKELELAKKDLTYKHSENIHIHMGSAYYKKKNFFQAEKHFSVARTMKEKDCSAALYHAKSLYFLKHFQKALDILESSKTWCENNLPLCDSPSYDSYFFAALAYDKIGQKQKAIFNLKIFLSKVEKSAHLKEAKRYLKLWKHL